MLIRLGAHEWLDFKMTLYQEQSSTARCKTDSASPRLSEMSSPFAETQANPFRPDPTRRASIAVYRKLTANALSLFGLACWVDRHEHLDERRRPQPQWQRLSTHERL
ncbi:hypothetical protein NW758_009264 [Fusarium oxysporum]|nr:hypothetical protein NW758_009264 [Fusarium oxysporum]